MATVAEELTTDQRLARIEALLAQLVDRETVREHYSVDELAELLGKTPLTVREWCRLGRMNASKRRAVGGAHESWVVSHEELLRYRRDGLLPIATANRTRP